MSNNKIIIFIIKKIFNFKDTNILIIHIFMFKITNYLFYKLILKFYIYISLV
jgi:hypothetical protein